MEGGGAGERKPLRREIEVLQNACGYDIQKDKIIIAIILLSTTFPFSLVSGCSSDVNLD